MKTNLKSLLPRLFLCASMILVLGFISLPTHAQNTQFEYDLKITADPTKRNYFLRLAHVKFF